MRVPDLAVLASGQRYEPVSVDDGRAVVRYVGTHGGFEDLITFEADGLVVEYPGLAVRL